MPGMQAQRVFEAAKAWHSFGDVYCVGDERLGSVVCNSPQQASVYGWSTTAGYKKTDELKITEKLQTTQETNGVATST